MRKFKNFIIYIIVCIIILASFKIPELLLEFENDNIEIAVYEREKKKRKIDLETEEIYLVKAIHDIESESSLVEISSTQLVEEYSIKSVNNETTNMNINMYNELLKLNEYDILKKIEINENDKIEIGLYGKKYKIDDNEYSINNVLLKLDNKDFMLEIEEKTGKILNIVIEKDYLYSEISKEEIMMNYVEYLDLDIIDDWKFEEKIISSEKYYWEFVNNMLKSEKAGLVVNLVENEDSYILSIHSSERISDMLQ